VVREKWRERGRDGAFRADHPGLDSLYDLKSPLTTLALIQEAGPRPVFVQSLHITNGAEFEDLRNLVTQLAGLAVHRGAQKPFPHLALGDSALGPGQAPDLDRAARALEPLVREARKLDAALVLMGHGNEHLTIQAYGDLARVLRERYGPVFLGLVEGGPGYERVAEEARAARTWKLLLAPFMLVAGDHALNDLAGESEDSWASRFKAEGFAVAARLRGLGELEAWADLYVERLRDMMTARASSH
jgi:sirohydrochlorin cobaltochelatase